MITDVINDYMYEKDADDEEEDDEDSPARRRRSDFCYHDDARRGGRAWLCHVELGGVNTHLGVLHLIVSAHISRYLTVSRRIPLYPVISRTGYGEKDRPGYFRHRLVTALCHARSPKEKRP